MWSTSPHCPTWCSADSANFRASFAGEKGNLFLEIFVKFHPSKFEIFMFNEPLLARLNNLYHSNIPKRCQRNQTKKEQIPKEQRWRKRNSVFWLHRCATKLRCKLLSMKVNLKQFCFFPTLQTTLCRCKVFSPIHSGKAKKKFLPLLSHLDSFEGFVSYSILEAKVHKLYYI